MLMKLGRKRSEAVVAVVAAVVLGATAAAKAAIEEAVDATAGKPNQLCSDRTRSLLRCYSFARPFKRYSPHSRSSAG